MTCEGEPRATRRHRTWALVAATAVAGVAAHAVAQQVVTGDRGSGVLWLVAVAAVFALAELLVVHVSVGRNAHALSFSEIPLVIGLVVLSPEQLLLARLAAAVPVFASRRRTAPVKIAFNLAWQVLETGVAVLVWHAVLGGATPQEPRGWVAVAAVVLATSALGIALVTSAIALDGGGGPRLREAVSLGVVMDAVNASLAVVVVLVLASGPYAWWFAALVIGALAVGYRSYDRLRRRSQALDRLNAFTQFVGRQDDLDAVAGAVLRRVAEALDAEAVALVLAGGRWGVGGQWVLRRGVLSRPTGDDDRLPAGARSLRGAVRIPRGRAAAGEALLESIGVRDVVAAPLGDGGLGDGDLGAGVLVAADHAGDVETFSSDDLRELQALANHAYLALENARRADLLRAQVAEREHQALHDELTGLPNRRGFLESLAGVPRAAVLLLDLDHFKEVNDTLGHHAGDRVLTMTAERIREHVPPPAVVARLGGDEFAVLLPDVDGTAALHHAHRLRDALSRPFLLDGLSVAVGASIGVSCGAAEEGSLLRLADIAMYSAKSERGGVVLHRPGLARPSPHRLTMLADLRGALAAGELHVLYQPKVAVDVGTFCGVEALVRWEHPSLGAVRPEDLVAVAEYGGLVTDLTRFVLGRALEECARWRDAGRSLGVSVNVTPRCLLDPAFTADVAHALTQRAIPAGQLTLELTETSLMTEPDVAIKRMQELRQLGVSLSVDDLGTGYSSLAYLQRLPVDEVKIDRSFLAEVSDPGTASVIEAITGLGRRFGRSVVAEGVEDESTWHRLGELGCDVAQGYWISRPVLPEKVLAWAQRWEAAHPVDLRTASRSLYSGAQGRASAVRAVGSTSPQ